MLVPAAELFPAFRATGSTGMWAIGKLGAVQKNAFQLSKQLGSCVVNQRRLATSNTFPKKHPSFDQYDFGTVEAKWQQLWKDQQHTSTGDLHKKHAPATRGDKKFYALAMFPVAVDMGHVRVYTISDCIARFYRLKGYKVLHPMGWDAFGLPAENAAIHHGIPPADWTYKNIDQMKQQMLFLGISFDWEKELATCDPSYYRWTQSLFLELYKAGLAYQKEAYVNWDPVDQTVLANEQVDEKGRSWRSGAVVEQKLMKQWFFQITKYAEPLLNDLDRLLWPDQVKAMQRNWIGKTSGAFFDFAVVKSESSTSNDDVINIRTFTTRPDTIFGVTFLALAPEHPLLQRICPASERESLQRFQEAARKLSDLQRKSTSRAKLSLDLKVKATHPFTGEHIPIFVTDYVLTDYGTGAVIGVPAHDTRDADFARQNNLNFRTVIQPTSAQDVTSSNGDTVYTGVEGVLVNSGDFSGLKVSAATAQLVATAQSKGFGGKYEFFRLRDWLVSRQRYWGAPIPIIHCSGCGTVPVPDEQLPVLLPKDVSLSGKGSPLAQLPSFVNCKCPKCGANATRDTDTMDTFVDSSWYFARYPDATNTKQIFSPAIVNKWMPVDLYVGGIEHAILHLLYSRFITKFLAEKGMLEHSEPFTKLLTQGMVVGKTYTDAESGAFLKPNELTTKEDGTVVVTATGKKPRVSWEKMSKSKFNGVDPHDAISVWGADTTRLYVLFKAPPDLNLEWDASQIAGPGRWLQRMHKLIQTYLKESSKKETMDEQEAKALDAEVMATVRQVTRDLGETQQFNTAISALMKLSNSLAGVKQKGTEQFGAALRTLLVLLFPMAPHFSAQMWEEVINNGPKTELSSDITTQRWPEADQDAELADVVQLVIQIQGRTRGTIPMPSNLLAQEQDVIAFATQSPFVKRCLEGKTVKKVIAVPGRKIINYVI